jgi:hypothetical protein
MIQAVNVAQARSRKSGTRPGGPAAAKAVLRVNPYLKRIEKEVMMKPMFRLAGVLLVCLLLAAAQYASAASEVYTNRGVLASISLDYETIVVEVPVENGSMTVGGPLVEGAGLKRDGRRATLEDFREGEEVTVDWRYTESGHRILGLYAK